MVCAAQRILGLAGLQFGRLQTVGVADVLLCGDAEEDGLVIVVCFVVIGGQVLLCALLLLVLGVLLHVGNQGVCGTLHLGRVELVGRGGGMGCGDGRGLFGDCL